MKSVITIIMLIAVQTLSFEHDGFAQEPSSVQINWNSTSGPYGGRPSTVYINPDTNDLWTWVNGPGLHVSRDNGSTWEQPNPPPTGGRLTFVSRGTLVTTRSLSHDSGYTWVRNGSPDSVTVLSIAADAFSQTILLSARQGLYRSTDLGMTWQFLFENIKDISSSRDRQFYATTDDWPQRYLRSNDGGLTWSELPFPPGAEGLHLEVAPDGKIYVIGYFEIWISSDQGETWISFPNLCQHRFILGIDGDGQLYTKGRKRGGDISRYSIDFTTFQSITSNLDLSRETHSFDNAVLGRDGRLVINFRQRKLFLSEDGGSNWQLLEKTGFMGADINTVLVEKDTGVWWAGTERDGLFTSADAGLVWEFRGFEHEGILAFERGPRTGEYWAALDQGGLYHTIDHGLNWNQQEPDFTFSLSAGLHYDQGSNNLFAFSPLLSNIFYSSDFGDTWHSMNAPFTSNADPPIRAIEVDANGTVYTAIRDPNPVFLGIYRTADLGQTWELLSTDFPDVDGFYLWDVQILVDSSDWIWVSSEEHIFYSSDGGQNWEYVAEFPDTIRQLSEGPNGAIWAAYLHHIIYSTDKGGSWSGVNREIDHMNWLSFDWDENRDLIVGGTSRGVYTGTSVFDTQNAVIQFDRSSKSNISISIYPNPTFSSGIVGFSLPSPSRVQLEIFDVLGKRVLVLEQGFRAAGEHSVLLDATELSTGVYFVRLNAGKFSQTRKMVVVR